MPGKVCQYCQQDCSDKPRVKDPSGGYFCKECYPAAQAAMKQSGSAKPISGAVVSSVFDEPIIPTADMLAPKEEPKNHQQAQKEVKETPPRSCPGCGILMPGTAVVCTNCGFNTASGKGLKTKIEKAKVIKEKKSSGGGIDIETVVCIIALVGALVGGGGVAAGLAMSDDMLTGVGVMGIGGAIMAVYIGSIVVALVRDGILWAVGIFLFPIVGLWWAFEKCQNSWLKLMFALVVILGIFLNVSGALAKFGENGFGSKKTLTPAAFPALGR